MLDPASISAAVALSSAAFSNLKKAFSVGRDIESMGNDLSRWMKASSDIDQAVRSTKTPPFYKKFLSGDTVEQAAVNSVIAQKRLEEQRYELQQFIKCKFGTKAWNDLLKMEADIRKQSTELIYKRQALKQKIIEGFFIFLLLVTVVGFVAFVLWLKKKQDE